MANRGCNGPYLPRLAPRLICDLSAPRFLPRGVSLCACCTQIRAPDKATESSVMACSHCKRSANSRPATRDPPRSCVVCHAQVRQASPALWSGAAQPRPLQ
jgi:hypothetical protein